MPRTRADLVNRVLSRLGHKEPGQDPALEDYERVDEEVDGVCDDLAARNIIYIADRNAIPDEIFPHLSSVLADALSDDFALVGEEAQKIAARAQVAEQRLLLMGQRQARALLASLGSTVDGLVKRVLVWLGRVPYDTAPAVDDYDTVLAAVPKVLATLAQRNVVYVDPEDTDLPPAMFNDLAVIVAAQVAPDFSIDPARFAVADATAALEYQGQRQARLAASEMALTREGLVRRALSWFRVLPIGATPDPADYDTVSNQVDTVVADLAERGIGSIDDMDSIPEAVFQHLSVLVANAVAPDFAASPDLRAELTARAEGAERKLRTIWAKTALNTPTRQVYF